MITKPKSYDAVEVMENFNKRLVDGYYEGIVTNAIVQKVKSKKDDKEYEILTLELDINSGDFKDYFKSKYDSDKRETKKWGITKDLFLESEHNTKEQNEKNARRLKEFVTSVEKSNANFTFDWDEKKLVGKKVGLAFGLREFRGSENNKIMVIPELRFFRSIDTIKDIDYSDIDNKLSIRTLEGKYVSYKDYYSKSNTSSDESSYITITEDDDIPF